MLARGLDDVLAVLLAVSLDSLFGEPPARVHPVVWMGKALAACGAPWPEASPAGAFARGALAWLLIAGLTLLLGLGLAAGIRALTLDASEPASLLLRALLLGVALKPLCAWRMLRDEVAEVESALRRGLEPARRHLSRIVGRDTKDLSPTVVRESALESLAENLNDSWVAPLFWFAVAGLPGAALYRFANTADAMWGVRGRFEWAGKWAARADDVLSFIPARLTAALLALSAWRAPSGLRRIARVTASPNGGWPMGMMALALDVRLSRPGFYILHEAGRAVSDGDIARGLRIAARAAWAAVALAALALLL